MAEASPGAKFHSMLPHKPALELDLEDDDELPLELPATSDDSEDEVGWEPDDDSDLGVDDLDDEFGLDADIGTGEPEEVEAALDEEEAGSWLDDGKPGASDDGDDPDLDEDPDEDDLTEGSEPASDSNRDDWDGDELELDEGEGLVGDGGEEGFGDESSSAELELDRLPLLDDASASEGDDAELDAFAAQLPDEPTTRRENPEPLEQIAPGLSCAHLGARLQLETLRHSGQPLHALIAAGEVGIGWDAGSLWVADRDSPCAQRPFASAEVPFALAATHTAERLVIALAMPSGLLCSEDAGRTFNSVAPPLASGQPLGAVALSCVAGTPRLWAAPVHGSLWASDDLGVSFTCVRDDIRVLRLRCTDGHTLLVFGRAANGSAHTLRSDDGQSFSSVVVPASEVERVQDLQVCAGITLCCRRAPSPQLVWQTHGGTGWVELSAHAAPPALLLEEEGGVSAYFCALLPTRMLLLRRTLTVLGSPPQIVTELAADTGFPLQLAGAHKDGLTILQLGTERAWNRLSLRFDGSLRG